MRTFTEEKRRELAQRIPGWGVDVDPSRRPGVPRRKPGAVRTPHEQPPVPQSGRRRILHPPDSPPTAVFGTTLPAKRLVPSGILRRIAYRVPQDKAGHWLTLIAADRFDVWEHRVRTLVRVAVIAGGVALAFAQLVKPRPRRRLARVFG